MRGRAPIPVSSFDARLSLDSGIRAPVGTGAEVTQGLGTGQGIRITLKEVQDNQPGQQLLWVSGLAGPAVVSKVPTALTHEAWDLAEPRAGALQARSRARSLGPPRRRHSGP